MATATTSKVNLAQIATICIGLVVTAGVIPEKYEDGLTQLALFGIPPLTIAFRTWFTKHPLRMF